MAVSRPIPFTNIDWDLRDQKNPAVNRNFVVILALPGV